MIGCPTTEPTFSIPLMSRIRSLRCFLFAGAAILMRAAPALAQSADGYVAQGDAAIEKGAYATALQLYEAALAVDSIHAGALWRAAQLAAELAEYDTVPGRRVRLESRAAEHARAAVRLDSASIVTRFALARVLGQLARTSSDPMTRALLGKETWDAAHACLAIAPEHAGCLHVLGAWHATVAALDPFSRRMAGTLVGTQVFERATWADAERNLLAAVKQEPTRMAHRLELGRAYAAQGKSVAARAQFQKAAAGKVGDPNDGRRRAAAKRALEQLARR